MKMHADELPIDAALVRRLVAAQFPEWAELPLEPVRYFGTDNAIYRLGDELSLRLPRREHNVLGLRKELHWLPRLAPLLPLAIPDPVANGEPGEGYPLERSFYDEGSGTTYRYCDGGAWLWTRRSGVEWLGEAPYPDFNAAASDVSDDAKVVKVAQVKATQGECRK